MFSCIYLTQIVPISPFYFGVLCSFFTLFMEFSINHNVKIFSIKKNDLVLFGIICILCIWVLINAFINNSDLKYPILLILTFLFFIFSFSLNTFLKNDIRLWLKRMIILVFILLFIEFVYRITHPKNFFWATEMSNFFYIYKFSSIMFYDTNETGFFELIFFSFLLYLRDKKIINIQKKVLFVCFVMLCFTFSRAAVLGSVVLMFFLYILDKVNIFVKFIIISISFFFIFLIINIFLMDGSFLTKIDIFERTYKYLLSCSVRNLLLGVGMNNSMVALGGIYGHNYITLFIVEYGIIGFILLITLFLIMFTKCHATLYILIPYLITGLSFAPYFLPYMYFFLGVIYNIERWNK